MPRIVPHWPPGLTLPGRAGRFLRHQLVEVRGVARVDLQPGAVPHPRQVLTQEVRGRVLASPLKPFPLSAATSASTNSQPRTRGSRTGQAPEWANGSRTKHQVACPCPWRRSASTRPSPWNGREAGKADGPPDQAGTPACRPAGRLQNLHSTLDPGASFPTSATVLQVERACQRRNGWTPAAGGPEGESR